MNKPAEKFLKISLVTAAVAILSACGGGGDMAGDTDKFFTSPEETKLKVAADRNGGCSKAAGFEEFVTIVGGRPPFRIHNPLPDYVRVDRTEASGKDPVFKVTSLGGCADPVSILVLDYHSRSAVYELTVEAEKAEESTPPTSPTP